MVLVDDGIDTPIPTTFDHSIWTFHEIAQFAPLASLVTQFALTPNATQYSADFQTFKSPCQKTM